MEEKNIIMFVTVLVTFIIGVLNFLILLSISKKERHTKIASTRRKERMDNFIIYYSKISAFVYPDTVKAYACNKDISFFEKLIESYSNINMLFDHRFPMDVQTVAPIKALVEKAIDYYFICKSDESEKKYKEEYYQNIKSANKLLNAYIGTEWSRLKKEVKMGKTVGLEKWLEIYKDSVENIDKNENIL